MSFCVKITFLLNVQNFYFITMRCKQICIRNRYETNKNVIFTPNFASTKLEILVYVIQELYLTRILQSNIKQCILQACVIYKYLTYKYIFTFFICLRMKTMESVYFFTSSIYRFTRNNLIDDSYSFHFIDIIYCTKHAEISAINNRFLISMIKYSLTQVNPVSLSGDLCSVVSRRLGGIQTQRKNCPKQPKPRNSKTSNRNNR